MEPGTKKEVEGFLADFMTRPIETAEFDFSWQRERIEKDWHFDAKSGFYRHGRFLNRRAYRVPVQMLDAV